VLLDGFQRSVLRAQQSSIYGHLGHRVMYERRKTMSVTQPPSDAPFGLDPKLAAGLAYLIPIIGGIVMLVGGGTNRFVKWAAAQSITLWVAWWVVQFVLTWLGLLLHLWALTLLLQWVLDLLGFGLWLWTFITAFQGKEVRVPVIADVTDNVFKTALT
jgi:uncharacterized membrane protein